jgi:hypothetical protein
MQCIYDPRGVHMSYVLTKRCGCNRFPRKLVTLKGRDTDCRFHGCNYENLSVITWHGRVNRIQSS